MTYQDFFIDHKDGLLLIIKKELGYQGVDSQLSNV